MAKHGFLGALPEILGGAALGATGLGLAGIGPLAGLGAGAGEAAGAGTAAADVAGAATPAAITAAGDPAAAALSTSLTGFDAGAAPLAATGVTEASTPLAAGAADALAGGVAPLATVLGDAGPVADMSVPGSTANFVASQGNTAFAAPLSGGPVIPDAPIVSADPPSATDLSIPAGYTAADYPSDVSVGDPGGGLFGQGGVFGSGGWFDKNSGWLKPLGSLGALGLSALMNRPGNIPGAAPVTAGAQTATTNAANLMAQANPNLTALDTGALPAGAQSAIDQAANSAKAAIRSNYASMGITGPYSGEAEALAAVDQQKAVQQNAQAQQLVNTGVREAQLAAGQQTIAGNEYLPLMNAAIKQNEQLQQALGRFVAGLA